ncbi:hypothetical protein TRFO_17492 [Tritrichomonas foetus]|uniref:PSP1 C-terminal domain-containing protein n=1 Tax=Tritrichomonas foetus TaxID=1144522 RepID=A0A1J4KT49_9EUKA|nr:hypothetical protein TRFO_17492 [Tritrichomonas foetus]|eukprot:OHT12661.1 hypothetical protein TRFO_17492 [Tritrichomonas foetus]
MSWDLFTNDDDDSPHDPPMTSLLPSSLRDVWDDQGNDSPNGLMVPRSPTPNHTNVAFGNPGSFQPSQVNTGMNQFPQSAPSISYMDINPSDVSFQGEIEQDDKAKTNLYYQVQFGSTRRAIFHATTKLQLNVNDFVLTEADRGFDVGRIVATIKKPALRDLKSAKLIVRLASQHEVAQLPQKAEREARALALCQAKVAELHLPMAITGAEFQFDGKKLTFYYTASSYVDFRVLVRTLFRVFGTRIWMCCTSDAPQ